MSASFLASLLLLAAAPNLTPLPDTSFKTDPLSVSQFDLLPPEATLSSDARASYRLSASALDLDSVDRLAAVRQQVAVLPSSEDNLQEFFAGDRRLVTAADSNGPGVGRLALNTADFGFSAQWQEAKQARLQLRLGRDRPLQLSFVETPSRIETNLSWQALPALNLMGQSRSDGGATFGGKVTFGEGRRHSFSLVRQDLANTAGTTEALLALGGAVPINVRYRFQDRGTDRWQIGQDLGAFSWEVLQQSGRLQVSTSVALARDSRGKRRASFDLEHSVQKRNLDTRALTTATLNSRLWGWEGTLGLAWNEQGQTGAVVSAQLPLIGPALNLKGSYRGLAINGRRKDYRLELRSRVRF